MINLEGMSDFLMAAIEAAQAAGGFLRAHFGRPLRVDEQAAHDIKLELDRRTQELIERILLGRFPDHAFLGEEGNRGAPGGKYEWIVDPLDGTVNYFYNVPHFSVSIALRHSGRILVGVIYDPLRDELWTAEDEGPAQLNGRDIRVSGRAALSEAILSVGVSKSIESIEQGMTLFGRMVRQAKKCRMMGSAALDMAYVASGRLDAYIESQISIWDIAAGLLLVERAGGSVQLKPHPSARAKFSIVARGGPLDLGIEP